MFPIKLIFLFPALAPVEEGGQVSFRTLSQIGKKNLENWHYEIIGRKEKKRKESLRDCDRECKKTDKFQKQRENRHLSKYNNMIKERQNIHIRSYRKVENDTLKKKQSHLISKDRRGHDRHPLGAGRHVHRHVHRLPDVRKVILEILDEG